jgi:hypothetical protein
MDLQQQGTECFIAKSEITKQQINALFSFGIILRLMVFTNARKIGISVKTLPLLL